jgi:sugar transferase (PEP-CTERM/EpsH1 system associated)
MRILFVCPYLPYPPNIGSRIRTFNIIRRLSQKHKIDLLALTNPREADKDIINELAKYCHRIEIIPIGQLWKGFLLFRNLFSIYPFSIMKNSSSEMKERLCKLLQERSYDIIQFEKLEMAQYIFCVPSNFICVLDNHNVETEWLKTYFHIESNPLGKLYLLLQLWKMRWYEPRMCSKFSCCLTVSETDKVKLDSMTKGKAVIVPILQGVDIEYFKPNFSTQDGTNKNILFVGSMNVRPNIDAALYFAKLIFPLILRQIPSATFTIVGRSPDLQVKRLVKDSHSIRVIGDVPDIRPFMRESAVMVNPIRFGGGVKTKVLEGMAMGMAIVSTEIGIEGIDAMPGKHLMVANHPDEFAEKVIYLLENPTIRLELGRNARKLVEEKYNWDKIVADLDKTYQQLLANFRVKEE